MSMVRTVVLLVANILSSSEETANNVEDPVFGE